METLVIRVKNQEAAKELLRMLEENPGVLEANLVQNKRFNELIEQMEDEIDLAAARAFDPQKNETFSVQEVEEGWKKKRAA